MVLIGWRISSSRHDCLNSCGIEPYLTRSPSGKSPSSRRSATFVLTALIRPQPVGVQSNHYVCGTRAKIDKSRRAGAACGGLRLVCEISQSKLISSVDCYDVLKRVEFGPWRSWDNAVRHFSCFIKKCHITEIDSNSCPPITETGV
jgi:hypothetical protein